MQQERGSQGDPIQSASDAVSGRRWALWSAAALVVLAVVAGSLPVRTSAQQGDEVDTALIVAVDVSNSVDDERYRLQMEGIAKALEDPGVIAAISGGGKGGILFSMITWADRPKLTLPWMRISNAAEAKAVALKVRKLPRQGGEFTCMSRMMRFVADKVAPQIPAKATKVVLDISGDGPDNCNAEEHVDQLRDELVGYGVTVNGLPILEGGGEDVVVPGQFSAQSYLPEERETAPLEKWYRENVKGGSGSFVLPANGYADFGRAIRQKFVLEITELLDRRQFALIRRRHDRGF